MADTGNIRVFSRIQLTETVEGNDTTNSSVMAHSRADSHSIQGASIVEDLADVTRFSIVKGLTTTASYVDIAWNDNSTNHTKDFIYDGLTANGYATVDFFYAKIDSAVGAGIPIAAFKFANQSSFVPQLSGVGDSMIIPMSAYNMSTGDYDIEVTSGATNSICKITCILADRS